MPKMFTDLTRHALNGPTMGTRWTALFHVPPDFDVAPAASAMTEAVAEVDRQMSTFRPDSDLNRLNAASQAEWVALPERLLTVLETGLAVGRASGGAFDIGMGDAIAAWGFGPQAASEERIRAARLARRSPAYDVLEIDKAGARARKQTDMRFDLNGIAKGFGVDRLTEVAIENGIDAGLFAIDGELRALGSQPDGRGWTIAIEAPDPQERAPHSVLELQQASIATSGDYRHWIDIGANRLSHTMDPQLGMPISRPVSSVTVVAPDCMTADAWATAMMVLGEEGLSVANDVGLSALFLYHGHTKGRGCGLFAH